MGHTEMEGLLFATFFDIRKGMFGRYMPLLPKAPLISKAAVFNDIRNNFFDNDTIGVEMARLFTEPFSADPTQLDGNGLRRAAVHAFGDYFLTCPTILFGAHIVKTPDYRGSVYQYRLTYAHKQSFARHSVWAEATHTDDLALVFGLPFNDRQFWSNGDRKLSKEMMNIWTHFAKYKSVFH